MKRVLSIPIQYSGFVVNVVGNNDPAFKRVWHPGEGEYEKNLFATYMYRGCLQEFRTDTGNLNNTFENEFFLNTNIVLDYPTYELCPEDTTWLCFSSWKPYTAEFVRLQGDFTVPADVGAYCALGKFTIHDQGLLTARALNYLKPRPYDLKISGNAKVILVKHGQFVNQPI